MEFSAKAFIYLHVNVYGNSFAIRNSWGKIAAQVICQNNILFEKNYIEQFNINISRYKVHFDKKKSQNNTLVYLQHRGICTLFGSSQTILYCWL